MVCLKIQSDKKSSFKIEAPQADGDQDKKTTGTALPRAMAILSVLTVAQMALAQEFAIDHFDGQIQRCYFLSDPSTPLPAMVKNQKLQVKLPARPAGDMPSVLCVEKKTPNL